LSSGAPDIGFTNGDGQPAAARVLKNTSNLEIQEWLITEASGGTGASDAVRVIGITPSGTIDESTDITSVKFYLDSGAANVFDLPNDILLTSSPITFAANNTKQNFTITGGIEIPQNTTVRVWVVYNLANSASNNETINQEIANGGDVTMGSGVALENADVSEASNTMTVDDAIPTYTVAATSKNNAGDEIALTFNEAMDTDTITTALLRANTNITLDYSDDAGNTNAHDISVAHATVVWSAVDTVATITLDEATDGAYIPNGKFVGATLLDVTDVVEFEATNNETYTAAGIAKEATAPTVSSWSLNMNTGTMTLNFSELMDRNQDIDETKITIQGNDNTDVAEYIYTLTNSASSWMDNDTLTVTLSTTDLNAIKANSNLGVTTADSYLEVVASSNIKDLVGNDLDLTNVTDLACIAATSVTADATSPQLTNFHLYMNDAGKKITLFFNEPVDVTTLDVTGITVQDAATRTDYYTLTNSTSASADGTQIDVSLSATDINAIKVDDSLATNLDDTYLSITSAAIEDMAGNAVTAIPNGSALHAGSYAPDIVGPALSSWTLNMNDGTAVLTFNEPVDVSSLAVGSITIQDAATAAHSYTFTNSTTNSSDGTAITINLSSTDLNALKADTNLAVSKATSYIVIAATAINDMALTPNDVIAIADGAGLNATSYTADATAPAVSNWTLNMNAGTLTVNFNEAMDQTVNPDETKFTIQANNDTDTLGAIYTLTNSVGVWTDSDTFTITFSATDLFELKLNNNLAKSAADSYLEIVAGSGIVDLAPTPMALSLTNVTDGSCIAATYIDDTTAPTVTVTAASNDNAGDTIVLTYNEPMDTNSLTQADIRAGNAITLDYSDNAGDTNQHNITLTNVAGVWSVSNTVFTITLNETTDGAYIPDGKYIGVTSDGTVADAGEHGIQATAEVYTAAGIAKEAVAPALASWTLNMNTGHLILTFGEIVNAASLDPTGIRIQNAATADYSRLLTGGATGATNSTSIDITMTTADVNAIKNNMLLAKRAASSSLIITSAVIDDMSGNAVTAIADGAGVQASDYTADTTAPTVSSQYPLNGDDDAAASVHPYVVFSEGVDPSYVNSSTVLLKDYDTDDAVSATVQLSDGYTTAVITPDASLTASGHYYIEVTSGVQDLAGNTATAYNTKGSQDFYIASASGSSDATAPTITTPSPADGGVDVAIGSTITVTMSEDLDVTTVNGNTVKLYTDVGNNNAVDIGTDTEVSATVTLENNGAATKIYIDPVANLANSGNYIYRVSTDVKDSVGNPLAANGDYDFTAVAATDTTAPTITTPSPADGGTDVAVGTTITVTMSENLDSTTVNGNTVKLYTDVGNNNAVDIGTDTEVSATVTLENNGAATKIYIDPVANLNYSGNYIYRISTNVKDSAGNPLAANGDYDFTTAALGNGSLALTIPVVSSLAKTYATADDDYDDGWAWDFYITVPTNETSFQIKFSNWQGSATTMAAANNMRVYSAQASASADAAHAVTITDANTYCSAMTLDDELTAAQAAAVGIGDPAILSGRQIKITVEVKVPVGTAGGSWSTQYQIHSGS